MLAYWKMLLFCKWARFIGAMLLLVAVYVLATWLAVWKREQQELEWRAAHVCWGYCMGQGRAYVSGVPLTRVATGDVRCRCGDPVESPEVECAEP